MKDRLQAQLVSLVAEHSSWLSSDDWLEVCGNVCEGYFEASDTDEIAIVRIADFIEALKNA